MLGTGVAGRQPAGYSSRTLDPDAICVSDTGAVDDELGGGPEERWLPSRYPAIATTAITGITTGGRIRRAPSIAQPELSNEVLPLVSVFAPPELCELPPLLAGAVPPAEGCCGLEGVTGALGVTGAFTAGALETLGVGAARTAGVTVVRAEARAAV
jgi:CBS domain-containing protein